MFTNVKAVLDQTQSSTKYPIFGQIGGHNVIISLGSKSEIKTLRPNIRYFLILGTHGDDQRPGDIVATYTGPSSNLWSAATG